MKDKNKYDVFIEKLAEEFSKIKNFHLTQEDEKGKKIFNFLTKRLAEINSFKTLFTNYYIPAASKSVVDDLNEIQKSKYKHLLQFSREDLKENYYETIRLAYIGMFHKYENYIDELIVNAELLTSDLSENGQPLNKYVEQIFQYRIKDWNNSQTIYRLNWISICNKHYDGYPRKNPKPNLYSHIPENEKMKLTKEDFIKDIDLLISDYTFTLTLVFYFAMHKIYFEEETFEVNEITNVEITQKLIEGKNQFEEHLRKLIELNKT